MSTHTVAIILALSVVGWHVYLGVVIYTLRGKLKKHISKAPIEAHGCYVPDSAA